MNDQLACECSLVAAKFPKLRAALMALRKGGEAAVASSLLADPAQVQALGAARDDFPAFGRWIGNFIPSSLADFTDKPVKASLAPNGEASGHRVIVASPGSEYENLQRAVDDLCPTGGVVLLAPNCIYEVPEPPLRIAAPNITIRGSGESVVCLPPKLVGSVPPGSPSAVVPPGFPPAVIEITNPETKPGQEAIMLDGFRIEGQHPRHPDSFARGHGVRIRGARQDITLHNLSVQNFADGDGVKIEDATGHIALHGLYVRYNGTGVRIVNLPRGVDRDRTGMTSLSGCMVLSSLGFNIAMRHARHVRLTACTLDDANLSSVTMTSSSDVVFVGCRFEANCKYAIKENSSQEIMLNLPPEMWRAQLDIGSPWAVWPADQRDKHCQGVCIQGCYFKSGYSRNGMFIRDGSDVSVIGNTFSGYTLGHIARDPSRSPEVFQVGNYDRGGNSVTAA